VHPFGLVNRNKFAILLAALIIPGGLFALLGAWLLDKASKTERGRRAVQSARARVPTWMTVPLHPRRRAT
jgi:hypothetical protein